MSTDAGWSNAGEYWTDLRPHPVTCTCAPDGVRCEQAQAIAEERSERREMSGRYPCGAYAPHPAQECPTCRRAWGFDAVADA